MKCSSCGVSVQVRILHRTKPNGQIDAGWMCEPCIAKTEPELSHNIQEDNKGFINDLKEALRERQDHTL